MPDDANQCMRVSNELEAGTVSGLILLVFDITRRRSHGSAAGPAGCRRHVNLCATTAMHDGRKHAASFPCAPAVADIKCCRYGLTNTIFSTTTCRSAARSKAALVSTSLSVCLPGGGQRCQIRIDRDIAWRCLHRRLAAKIVRHACNVTNLTFQGESWEVMRSKSTHQ